MPTPYIVEIPSDVTALPIEGLGELLASAIYDVESDTEDEGVKWACTALEFDNQIRQALERGQLLPRHPGTHTPSSTLPGSVLDVEELRDFLAANRWRVQLRIVTPEQEPQAAAPERTATDFAMLASREQLIAAFGAFTGMKADWFDNIKDKPALLAARRITGQGGRGHLAEPFFCPFDVMQWLVSAKRRTGKPLREAKGWELLEKHFPKVYASRSIGDPREA